MKALAPKDGESVALVVGENEELVVVERGAGTFSVRLELGENAHVKYFSLSDAISASRTATLAGNASVFWVDAAVGGGKSTVVSELDGEGADAEYRSVLLGAGDESYAVTSRMVHKGNKSTSNMLTRAVMFGKSSGMYEGLIRIDKDAEGCDAYQKQDTLLMSEDARMDATPNLEISNENVRCSHGVSLGQVDEEKLFYFRARGIPEKQAVQLIVHGFFAEILESMGAEGAEIRKDVDALLERAA